MTDRTLDGVRVAVLRVGDPDDAICAELERRGASATTVRVGSVVDRPDAEVLAGAGVLSAYRWVAVSSASAARRLSLWATTWPPATRIAAVGPRSAAAVESAGLVCAVVAPLGTAASLASSIDEGPVLFMAASTARRDLVDALVARGIRVVRVDAYDVEVSAADQLDGLALATSDVLVALSPVAIDALVSLGETARALPVVAIGPTTARHAATLGWPVARVAAARDEQAVSDAVSEALGR